MILVTGATGFLGHMVVKQLTEQGREVRALVIKNDPLISSLDGLDCDIYTGDITKPESLVGIMEGIETVIHLAAIMVSDNKELFHWINYEGTKNVVCQAVESKVKHFIYVSAAAADYKIRTDYGDSKFESEKLMKKQGSTNFTIIRPSIIYASHGGQELDIYTEFMKKIPLFFPLVGSGNALKKPVYVDGVVDGLCKLVDKPVSYGKTYNFNGGSDINMLDFTRLWAKAHGVQRLIIPIPMPLIWITVKFLGIFMKNPPVDRNMVLGIINDANFSNEDAVMDIGYNPITLKEGFKKAFDMDL